jgi:predicted transcriptional regulator
MPPTAKNSTLSDILVKEAMRRQAPSLSRDSAVQDAIKHLIKFKVSALLIRDDSGRPLGVVSKTDIVSAYYAGLPVDTPLESIMVGPPLMCRQEDSLESALQQMRSNSVYRLYVTDESGEEVFGALAYPDIVALLYVYCRGCNQSAQNRRKSQLDETGDMRFRVRDVMTSNVVSFNESDTLSDIMEGMSGNRFSAVLIRNISGYPVGVISKTDLLLAFNHGISTEEQARCILNFPSVRSCSEDQFLEDAIKEMIFSELHRLFVHAQDVSNITGVLSLSDVARFRSGSCHACVGARITIK